MLSRSLTGKAAFSGITIGGSGGGQPLPLVILTVIVVAMALVTVYRTVVPPGPDYGRKVDFKCMACGAVEIKTAGDLRDMRRGGGDGPRMMTPMTGPIILVCPQCGEKEMTTALKCYECGEIFLLDRSPGKVEDRYICPKCGQSYRESMRKKRGKKSR